MPRHSSHMLDLARRGAEARYRELVAELKMLAQAFPHLRDSFDRDELPVNFLLRVGRDKAAAAPTRRISARGRAAISAAQKARWKRQKAGEKNK